MGELVILRSIARFLIAGVSVVALIATQRIARADVVYSNFGNPPASTSHYLTLLGATSGTAQFNQYASPFIINGAGDLLLQSAGVVIANDAAYGSAHTLNVQLFTGVNAPETQLASTTIPNVRTDPYLATADFSSAGIILHSGIKYW